MKSRLLFVLAVVVFADQGWSQCGDGEVPFTMNVYTDAWPYEGYWELVPGTNSCGDGTIEWGNNQEEVGCSGGGEQNATESATSYPANTMVPVDSVCLILGETYTLHFVDDWGDGGSVFELYENGVFTNSLQGSGQGNTWTFEAGTSTLPANDAPCGAFEIVPDGGVVEMNNAAAVAQFAEPHPAPGPCGLYGVWCDSDPNISNTVWGYFIAGEGVSYEITTCHSEGSFDTQLALYHADDCLSYNSFELVTSNDDMLGGCGQTNVFASKMYASCLIPGDKYYIQVDGWGGETGTTYVGVTTYEGEVSLDQFVNDVPCPVLKGQTANGSIFPFVVGGGSDFTSEWTGPGDYTSDNNSIFELGAGTYSLTLTTACGDVFMADYEIFEPEPWSVIIDGTGPDCEASNNGSIDVTTSGATGPYEYAWSGPDLFASNSEHPDELDNGTYELTVTDDHGCTWEQSYDLMPLNSFEFDLGEGDTLCLDDSEVISAPAGLSYSWQDGSINQFYELNAEEWGVGTDYLILIATTDDGCSYTDAYPFTIEDCAGMNENYFQAVSVYPNPASDFIMIDLPGSYNDVNVRIHDMAGKLVSSMNRYNTRQFRMDIALPAGIYNVSITADKNVWVNRFIAE